jgi:hypothetical protein
MATKAAFAKKNDRVTSTKSWLRNYVPLCYSKIKINNKTNKRTTR